MQQSIYELQIKHEGSGTLESDWVPTIQRCRHSETNQCNPFKCTITGEGLTLQLQTKQNSIREYMPAKISKLLNHRLLARARVVQVTSPM